MATVIFTMNDGTVRTAVDVTPMQANATWWHLTQFQSHDAVTVKLLGEGSDIRDVADVEVRLTPEGAAINPRVHGVRP